MNTDQREIRRKLRILEHAEQCGNIGKTCRYFGIGRSSFYRWRIAYRLHGEVGLINSKPVPKIHPNQTPDEVVEKVLHLRRKYHLGQSGLFGAWSATTASQSPMQAFTGYCAAMG